MARLLVSVRNEDEARAALAGGAAIVDVKEPSEGPLGMASCDAWPRVRRAVPPPTIVSVALGELKEWRDGRRGTVPGDAWSGIGFRKLGLAGAGPAWREEWKRLRESLDGGPTGVRPIVPPSWVAVVYLDWASAEAPEPSSIIREAVAIDDCTGVLFDTWDKNRRVAFDPGWARWIQEARESGRFVALAGSLEVDAIRRLRPLGPDIFAVRGAACRGGDRDGPVDPERVARLVEAAG